MTTAASACLCVGEQRQVPPGWVANVLSPKMMQIAQQVCRAAQAKFIRRRGLFELLGLDFMVDSVLDPWLIEVLSLFPLLLFPPPLFLTHTLGGRSVASKQMALNELSLHR